MDSSNTSAVSRPAAARRKRTTTTRSSSGARPRNSSVSLELSRKRTPSLASLEQATGGDNRRPFIDIFAEIAQVNHHPAVKDKELGVWVRDEANARGMKLAPGAVRALVEAIGPDLWALHNELVKLETLAPDAQIGEDVVRESVAQAREAKVWDLTDAVVAGDERKAMRTLSRLLIDGEPPPLLSSMIARQYRQLAVTKELSAARAPDGEVARAAGIPEWKVREVSSLASRYSWATLRRAYALLVEADLSVKRGLQDDESSLQLLVHELCSLAPRAATAARR